MRRIVALFLFAVLVGVTGCASTRHAAAPTPKVVGQAVGGSVGPLYHCPGQEVGQWVFIYEKQADGRVVPKCVKPQDLPGAKKRAGG